MQHLDFILIDFICLHISFIIAFMVKYGVVRLPYSRMSYGIISIVITLISFVVSVMFDTYRDVLSRGAFEEFKTVCKQVLISIAALTLCLFTFQKGSLFSRIMLSYTYLFYAILVYAVRLIYKRSGLFTARNKRSMLLITTRAEAEPLLKSLIKTQYAMNAAAITGIAIIDEDMTDGKIMDKPVIASGDSVIDYAKRQWVDEVFISLPQSAPQLKEFVSTFEEMGMTVHLNLDPYVSIAGGRKEVERIGNHMVVTSSINMSDPVQMFFKRLMDIIGGLVGTLLMCVFAIFVVPLQQINSPGPVFFRQERIGKNGKHFKMYKFRSMCMDAEAKKAALMDQNRVSDGMMFKLDWDPRIIGNVELPDGTRKTGIGEFIRRTSIDEFPQFLNVLKGEMSLVGTRPPTVDEWEKYDTHHRVRMAMKPGITGMWQVSGRSEITDFEEVVELDRRYIEQWSIGLDIKLLFKTVGVVLKHKGAM